MSASRSSESPSSSLSSCLFQSQDTSPCSFFTLSRSTVLSSLKHNTIPPHPACPCKEPAAYAHNYPLDCTPCSLTAVTERHRRWLDLLESGSATTWKHVSLSISRLGPHGSDGSFGGAFLVRVDGAQVLERRPLFAPQLIPPRQIVRLAGLRAAH